MLMLEREEVQEQFNGYYFDIGMQEKENKITSQDFTADTSAIH